MTSVYDIVRKVKDTLYAHPIVNTVTFGDITQIDLSKTTIFPLTHFTVSSTEVGSSHLSFNLSFIFMDIVDYTKTYVEDIEDRDDGTNLLDILNTQLQIANEFISSLRRGTLHTEGYHLEGEPVCRMFKDKYENQLAGWRVDLTIMVRNNISVC